MSVEVRIQLLKLPTHHRLTRTFICNIKYIQYDRQIFKLQSKKLSHNECSLLHKIQDDHSWDNVKFPDGLRHSSAALGMLSVIHIMPVLWLNTCIYANMQLTRNSFRQLFHDEIFSLTFPWLIVKSLTFPSQLSNSPTFPGFLDKWSPGKLKTKESKKLNRTRSSAVTDRLCDASLKLFCHTYLITLLML